MLEKHAPRKKRHLRTNPKTIITRARLRNYFWKKDAMKIDSYFVNKECVSLLRKAKKYHFTILNEKIIIENKWYWKIVKPFLPNKVQRSERIKLAGP